MLYSSLQSTGDRGKAMAALLVECDFWPILLMVKWYVYKILTIPHTALSTGLHYTVHTVYYLLNIAFQ